MIARCAIGFLLSLIAGFLISPLIFAFLRRKKLNQIERGRDTIRDLADLHREKNGTATMGGLAIFLSALIPIVLLAKLNLYVLLTLFVCTSLGGLGFVDDFLKLSKKNVRGVSGRKKMVIQLAVAAVVLWALHRFHGQDFAAMLPFLGWCPRWIFLSIALAFTFCVVAGASNSVNLTDGLDGLASLCVIPNCIFYAAAACILGSVKMSALLKVSPMAGAGELAIVLSCFCGALLVFLWYNSHPASVIMGDTGSLMLGGLLAVSALLLHMPFCLLLTGIIFVIEALSDIIQVGSSKLRHGKKVFRMAPIHHHFELSGVKETKIVARAGIITWISSAVCAIILLYVG
ncbi:MAG: phospho-N-acetylmuramoyl-pentapeptide-transferase [Puniceicoccales bacterium]|jgi:phospho-N-acetylmuramoyl-pentapeptide-transferase|nr:phospho-N-acetylmuramoyl-pentapeptide-transferase [Puniceicoccales bacterium]